MSIRKSLFIGVVALGLGPIAFASNHIAPTIDTWAPGVYIGLQTGYGMTHWDDGENFADYLLGFSNIIDVNASTGRIYLGYDFHKNIAIEIGNSYFFNKPSADWVKNDKHFRFCGNTWAIDLIGVVKINIIDNFGLLTKIGVNYLQTNSGDYDFDEVHNFNLAYGAGVFYNFTKNFTIDISWLRYNGNEKMIIHDYQPNTDMFTVGLKYKFLFNTR
jgi:opacity protein-like surface antigen